VNQRKEDINSSLLASLDAEVESSQVNFENLPESLKNVPFEEKLLISNLKKKYATGKVAVNDLSITMYKNQIFALLGHNGAGKTTTMSMLTGMITPSSGEAYAFGTSIFDDLDSV